MCGLARNYCVRFTAEDGVDLGFSVTVHWQLTDSVSPDGDNELRTSLIERGVELI